MSISEHDHGQLDPMFDVESQPLLTQSNALLDGSNQIYAALPNGASHAFAQVAQTGPPPLAISLAPDVFPSTINDADNATSSRASAPGFSTHYSPPQPSTFPIDNQNELKVQSAPTTLSSGFGAQIHDQMLPSASYTASSLSSALDTAPISLPITASTVPAMSVNDPMQSAYMLSERVPDDAVAHYSSLNSLSVLTKDISPDPQSWLMHMYSSIRQSADTALDATRAGQSALASSKTEEIKNAISEVSKFLNRSLTILDADSSSSENSVRRPLTPPPVPLDTSSMTVPSDILDSNRKRSSTIAPPAQTMFRRLTHELKTEPQAVEIPPANPLVPPPLYPPPTIPEAVPVPLLSSQSPNSNASRPPTPRQYDQYSSPYSQSSSAPLQFSSDAHVPLAVAPSLPQHMTTSVPPFLVNTGSSWTEPVIPGLRHRHTLSAGARSSSFGDIQALAYHNGLMSDTPSQAGTSTPHSVITPVRAMRSGSLSGPLVDRQQKMAVSFDGQSVGIPSKPKFFIGQDASNAQYSTDSALPSPESEDDGDYNEDDDNLHGGDLSIGSPSGLDLAPDILKDVDKIFSSFLNNICSNLEAKDKKGEPIHQPLMAKKMARLDESKDFRPFKFRIQAFTRGFVEELAAQGYTDDKIQSKKIRQYLWRQPYILRFNEDGKKAKSKGNHIWIVEARKLAEGHWEFRPFHRRLAGGTPGVAYPGLTWSWSPHVWDPQSSFKDVPVRFSSPDMPSWLSWQGNTLSGIPPLDAEGCEITIDAQFVIDNKEEQLSTTFRLNVAPGSATERSRSRRTSLIGDALGASSRTPGRPVSKSQSPPHSSNLVASVSQVLQLTVQRVAQERHQHINATSLSEAGQFEVLCKQQHVLQRTVQAYDKEVQSPGLRSEPSTTQAVLAKTGEQVVLQAAQSVKADKAVPSVMEVSIATQDAVARAVERTGVMSHELDVMRIATHMLKEKEQVQTRSPTTSNFTETTTVEGLVPGQYIPMSNIPRIGSYPAIPSIPAIAEYQYVS